MFGKLLTLYRQRNGITQRLLAEQLSHYDEMLAAVNSVTVSRWETGVTTPGVAKKKVILRFLAEKGCLKDDRQGCLSLFVERYRSLERRLREIFNKRYQYIIGNYPDFGEEEYSVTPLRKHPDWRYHLEHMMDIERVTNKEGYYTPDFDLMRSWVEHPGSLCYICTRREQNLGHFMMVKIAPELGRDIAHYRRNEFDISPEEMRFPHERGSYYIQALYGSNPRVAALLNIEAYIHFLKHYDTIEDVIIFSTRPDGPKITKDYGIAQVASGFDQEFGFEWHGMLSPVDKILFSEGMITTLFP